MWKSLCEVLLGFLKEIEDGQRESAERRKLALVTVLSAANQTRGYIAAKRRPGAKANSEREHALSGLWDICWLELQHFDQDLARRCRLKAEYWRSSEKWSRSEIDETCIGLDRVQKEAEYLLQLRIRPSRKNRK